MHTSRGRAWTASVIVGVLILVAGTQYVSAGVRRTAGRRCHTVRACWRAIDWHKQHEGRLREAAWVASSPTLLVAARIAGATYGVDPWSMLRVAHCEVRELGRRVDGMRYVEDQNRSSGALGAWQWLAGTWDQARNPYRTFDRTDVYVEALATAWLVRRDGGWREWSCGWAA